MKPGFIRFSARSAGVWFVCIAFCAVFAVVLTGCPGATTAKRPVVPIGPTNPYPINPVEPENPNDGEEPDAEPGKLIVQGRSGHVLLVWVDERDDEDSWIVQKSTSADFSNPVVLIKDADSERHEHELSVYSSEDRTTVRWWYRVAPRKAGVMIGPWMAAGPVNPVGRVHPRTPGATFAPVDLNGDDPGFGWTDATWGLGARYTAGAGSDVTFGVYSSAAERVLLELYSQALPGVPVAASAITWVRQDYWLEKGENNIWRAQLSNVPEGTYYTFRVWGPGWDWTPEWTRGNSDKGFVSDIATAYGRSGHRFNPNKTVFDPYTYEISHDKENPYLISLGLNGHIYATGPGVHNFGAHGGSMPRRNFDNGIFAPKGIILYSPSLGSIGARPNLPQEDLIVMETHVRGLTRHDSAGSLASILSGFDGFDGVQNIPESKRGTYAGAALMAPYLKGLGFTAIELLPVHETANDDNTEGVWSATTPGQVPGNFWGYMTYGFFAPDRRYSSDKTAGGPTREFRDMVNAFHAEGIEVILDVVYNHTGEGGSWGDSTLDQRQTAEMSSFKGFDNEQYYMLTGSGASAGHYYMNYSGTGNVMDVRNQIVQDLVIDSLTYWIDEMGASGFRFDLAYILGRTAADYGFQGGASPLLNSIRALGNTKNAKMIAEAWDLGGYGVGGFPSGSGVGDWAEWNDKFRDPLRDWIRRTGGGFTSAFAGSSSTFPTGPHKTVNFIVAHDGFTMMDLVSYNMNSGSERDAINLGLRYPFGPSDGGKDNNRSWDHGGDTALRRQQMRNLWTMLMLARGVPMTVYGDEFGRTQNGNNNPYKIDTVATWNNYNMLSTNTPHTVATGTSGPGYHNNYGTDTGPAGKNAFFSFARYLTRLRRDSAGLKSRTHGGDFTLSGPKGTWVDEWAFRTSINGGGTVSEGIFLVMANSNNFAVNFDLWDPGSLFEWRRIINTDSGHEANANVWPLEGTTQSFTTASADYSVPARSIIVFQKAYRSDITPASLAGAVTALTRPALGDTGLMLPEVPAGFTIGVQTSSAPGVIALSGVITPPVATTVVNVTLRVTKTEGGATADTVSLAVLVPGTGSGTPTITRLRTNYNTNFGEDIFVLYRIRDGVHTVQDWTTASAVWAGGGTQGGNEYNWELAVSYSGAATQIDWKAFMRKSGASDSWMPDPDRTSGFGQSHFSAWNNSVNHYE